MFAITMRLGVSQRDPDVSAPGLFARGFLLRIMRHVSFLGVGVVSIRCATSRARRSASYLDNSTAMNDEPKPELPLIIAPTAAPPLFKGALQKVARAQKHIEEFEKEVVAFLATHPARFEMKVDSQMKLYQDKFTIEVEAAYNFAAIPDSLGPIVGDAIHNLRSALDMMACELARLNHRSDKRVHFPFCDKAEELTKVIKDKNFHRCGQEAVDLLKELRPHKGGNIALRALHDLDVQDKHHTLIPAFLSASTPAIMLRNEHGQLIWPQIVGDPNEPTSVQLVFPPDSAFAGQAIIPTLHGLVKLVTGIIEAFVVIGRKRETELG